MNGLLIGSVLFFVVMAVIAPAICAHLLKDGDVKDNDSDRGHSPTPLL